jgi:predicted metalloenzyme YecM
VEEMAHKADSIQLPKDLVADLLESSSRLQEIAETLEVQLDEKTVKRLRIGDKELKKRQYKTASGQEDIDRILSSWDMRQSS